MIQFLHNTFVSVVRVLCRIVREGLLATQLRWTTKPPCRTIIYLFTYLFQILTIFVFATTTGCKYLYMGPKSRRAKTAAGNSLIKTSLFLFYVFGDVER
ncbi:hypothetical protein F4775DRAFT_558061 [Biscogniauxia sp. FL1348]|nr:hypothetical protein F4775DRAFT_558061 [Biscogniauxia sp. FL1348]